MSDLFPLERNVSSGFIHFKTELYSIVYMHKHTCKYKYMYIYSIQLPFFCSYTLPFSPHLGYCE